MRNYTPKQTTEKEKFMKQLHSLIAIIVAIVIAQNAHSSIEIKNQPPKQVNGTWYTAVDLGGEVDIVKENLNIELPYPSDYVTFYAYTTSVTNRNRIYYIDFKKNGKWEEKYDHSYKFSDNKNWNEQGKSSVDTDAEGLAFVTTINGIGSGKRLIRDIDIRMAPHTKMNTSSIAFSKVSVGTTATQTIDFYSFLSGSNGIQISVVDENEQPINIPELSLNRTSIGKSECEKINENAYSITVTFKPQSIISYPKCYIRITNSGASIGSTIDIPITTLSSAFAPPTLKVDEVGYTYAKISWTPINGAEKYYLYDNGTHIGTYTTTSATITGLNYGSSHKYTVTSVYGSAVSNHSNAVPANCPAYPKVQNVRFTSIGTNSLTAQWDPVSISPANHALVVYHVHFYKIASGLGPGVGYTTTNTSFTFNDLIDVTQYTVYVDVEYKYTLNGSTRNVAPTGSNWTSASVTTASFVPTSSAFDDVAIYQGEWYRVNAGISHEMGTGKGCQITLKEYPCENLRYKAWVKSEGLGGNHFISEDATNIEYQLSGGNTTYLEGNKFQTPTEPIKPEYVNINFQSRREWGTQKIYVSDMYAKIAPHIKIKTNAYINAQYPYIPFGRIRLNGESVTATINFQSFLVFNELKVTSTNPKFKLSKSVIAPATTSKAGTFCKQGETKYDFTITFTPDELGSHSSRITITDGVNSIAFTVDATVYSKNRLHVAGDWNNSSNWFFGVPAPTEDVEIAAAVTIPNGYTAITNDVSIESGGSISIAPQGALKVNTISGANANNLSLQANENGSATLLFKNTDKVNASIQLYSIASSDGLRDSIAGNFKDPKWQYLGIIAESAQYSALNPDGTTNWMYRWDETKNSTSCWAEKLKSGSTLSAWIGYGIAQEQATLYNYSGTLINSDHTYNLTFTSNDGYTEDRGYNLITNSYSAPIDIATINTTNFVNAVENIYIYNTGSYAEWRDNNNPLGFGPGQMISIPVNSISALGNEYPHTIPSGQAFFVKANNNSATFTVNYNSNVYNATNTANQKRAPKADSNEFNVLKIQVTSSTSNDRLYLLEHENCTPNFDNGYDAEKIFDNPNGPQIYASNTFGYTSINTDTTFNGQTIGFIANSESEIYTMTFDIEKLHSYNEIYLYDSQTGIYTNILEEELYQFYGDTKQTDNRFSIIAKRNESPKSDITTSTEIVTLEELFAQNKTIYLYTTTGQLVNIIEPNCQIDKTLPTGIYIVKCGDKILKVKF